MAAFLGAPTLYFIWECSHRLWKLQWRRLFTLVLIAFVISIAVAVGQFFFSAAELLPGGSYDWWNPGSVMLLATGAWFVGLVLLVSWVFSVPVKLLQFRKSFRRSEPQGA